VACVFTIAYESQNNACLFSFFPRYLKTAFPFFSSAAFNRLRMRPRILRDVSKTDMSTTVLGQKIEFPICLAPTAMQQMAHPDGELATARATAKHGTIMTLSSWSTLALEDVMAAAPQGPKWFQLYVYKVRK